MSERLLHAIFFALSAAALVSGTAHGILLNPSFEDAGGEALLAGSRWGPPGCGRELWIGAESCRLPGGRDHRCR